VEIRNLKVTSAARTHFSREQSHEGKPQPLSGAKRLEELLLGVMKRGTDGIDCGNRQTGTSLQGLNRSKVQRSTAQVKSILRGTTVAGRDAFDYGQHDKEA
jgi:hypothetical protein